MHKLINGGYIYESFMIAPKITMMNVSSKCVMTKLFMVITVEYFFSTAMTVMGGG